jgi:4a-hydroxytetrahydrobiopterin dehydratase
MAAGRRGSLARVSRSRAHLETLMSELSARHCVPCSGGTPRLRGEEIARLRRQLHRDWQVVDEHHLERTFRFPDFRAALAFTNRVGELAEAEQHHPDLHLAWGKVIMQVWTHKIDGLSENDFILAARADALA